MAPRTRRRFDATWLPFGMMIGFTVGIGLGLSVIDNIFLGALIGFAVGIALGVALGFRDPRRSGGAADSEDAADDRYRREHGDPATAAPTDPAVRAADRIRPCRSHRCGGATEGPNPHGHHEHRRPPPLPDGAVRGRGSAGPGRLQPRPRGGSRG